MTYTAEIDPCREEWDRMLEEERDATLDRPTDVVDTVDSSEDAMTDQLTQRRAIINDLRLDETLAAWSAAQKFLDKFGTQAEAHINCAIGFGITPFEAAHLVYLVEALRKETR